LIRLKQVNLKNTPENIDNLSGVFDFIFDHIVSMDKIEFEKSYDISDMISTNFTMDEVEMIDIATIKRKM